LLPLVPRQIVARLLTEHMVHHGCHDLLAH